MNVDQLDDLRHMLGAVSNVKHRDWGFRNYYCANPGNENMAALEAEGLVWKGRDDGQHVYYHATELGCRAAGLNAKQTKRALEPS